MRWFSGDCKKKEEEIKSGFVTTTHQGGKKSGNRLPGRAGLEEGPADGGSCPPSTMPGKGISNFPRSWWPPFHGQQYCITESFQRS